MWVFCGGMRRSGSTLQFQLTAHLVEQAGLGSRVDAARAAEFPHLQEEYAGQSGWKVFKSHRCTPEMAAEVKAGNATGVYVFRDIRDVLVSWRDWSNESIERASRGTLDAILGNFERWTSLEGVLISRYEEMVADVPAEVRRIAAHLDIPVSREESESIAAQYSVARQLKRIEQGGEQVPGGPPRAVGDRGSNLRRKHIRSGEAGRWATVLSRRQVALIEGRAEEWLLANGYHLALPRWQRVPLQALNVATGPRFPWGRRKDQGPHGAGSA